MLRPGEAVKRLCSTVEDNGSRDGGCDNQMGTRALYGAHIYASIPSILCEILKPGQSSKWPVPRRIPKSHGLKEAKTQG